MPHIAAVLEYRLGRHGSGQPCFAVKIIIDQRQLLSALRIADHTLDHTHAVHVFPGDHHIPHNLSFSDLRPFPVASFLRGDLRKYDLRIRISVIHPLTAQIPVSGAEGHCQVMKCDRCTGTRQQFLIAHRLRRIPIADTVNTIEHFTHVMIVR